MKKITMLCVCILLFCTMAFAQESQERSQQTYGQDLVQGLEAYKVGNWEDSLFFLKRTSNFQNATSDAVWYFVIMAEMNIGDYTAALRDGKTFLEIFQDSVYVPEITYQTLYASYELGLYSESIDGFMHFINAYPDHNLVASAVFYSGEALYNMYDFSRAKSYFDRIVIDFPHSTLYDDAVFRLELLEQREREEKLLYLLRVTGEEAVAAKEDYERQIKQLQSEEALILRKRLQELEQEHSKLQVEKQELLAQNETLRDTVQELNSLVAQSKQVTTQETASSVSESTNNADSVGVPQADSLIDELSIKALELQRLLSED